MWSWCTCVSASNAVVRTATSAGKPRRRPSLAWRAHSAPAADHAAQKIKPDPFYAGFLAEANRASGRRAPKSGLAFWTRPSETDQPCPSSAEPLGDLGPEAAADC